MAKRKAAKKRKKTTRAEKPSKKKATPKKKSTTTKRRKKATSKQQRKPVSVDEARVYGMIRDGSFAMIPPLDRAWLPTGFFENIAADDLRTPLIAAEAYAIKIEHSKESRQSVGTDDDSYIADAREIRKAVSQIQPLLGEHYKDVMKAVHATIERVAHGGGKFDPPVHGPTYATDAAVLLAFKAGMAFQRLLLRPAEPMTKAKIKARHDLKNAQKAPRPGRRMADPKKVAQRVDHILDEYRRKGIKRGKTAAREQAAEDFVLHFETVKRHHLKHGREYQK